MSAHSFLVPHQVDVRLLRLFTRLVACRTCYLCNHVPKPLSWLVHAVILKLTQAFVQVSNAAARSNFEIVVRDPVKHGDSMSVSFMSPLSTSHPSLDVGPLTKWVASATADFLVAGFWLGSVNNWTHCNSGGVYRHMYHTKFVQIPPCPSIGTSSRRSSGGSVTLPGFMHACESKTGVRITICHTHAIDSSLQSGLIVCWVILVISGVGHPSFRINNLWFIDIGRNYHPAAPREECCSEVPDDNGVH